MVLVKWEIARGLDHKHIRMEGEGHLRDLNLRIQISVICELLVKGCNDLSKIKVSLQLDSFLHSRLRVCDHTISHIL